MSIAYQQPTPKGVKHVRVGSAFERLLTQLPDAVGVGGDPSRGERLADAVNRAIGLTDRAMQRGAKAVRYDARSNALQLDYLNWPFEGRAMRQKPELRPEVLLQNTALGDLQVVIAREGLMARAVKDVLIDEQGRYPSITTWAPLELPAASPLSNLLDNLTTHGVMSENRTDAMVGRAVGLKADAVDRGITATLLYVGPGEDDYEQAWPLRTVSFEQAAAGVAVERILEHLSPEERSAVGPHLYTPPPDLSRWARRTPDLTLDNSLSEIDRERVIEREGDSWHHVQVPAAESAVKLHVYCETIEDVLEVTRRIHDTAVSNGVPYKAASRPYFTQFAQLPAESRTPQSCKGVVLYLPMDKDPSALAAEFAGKLDGYRHGDKTIEGNNPFGNGLSYRMDRDITGRYIDASVGMPGPEVIRATDTALQGPTPSPTFSL